MGTGVQEKHSSTEIRKTRPNIVLTQLHVKTEDVACLEIII